MLQERTTPLRPWLILIAALLALQLAATISGDNWNYTVASPQDAVLVDELNRLGASGYEVVAARRAVGHDREERKAAYEVILKKRWGLRDLFRSK